MKIFHPFRRQTLCALAGFGLLLGLSAAPRSASGQTHALTPSGGGSPAYLPFIIDTSFAWGLQPGSPAYLANYINTAGCNYMGMIGQAFNSNGMAILNLFVHLEGGGLNVDGVTGSEPSIGPGAYKINLGDHPITTTNTYRVQLRNASGIPLSDMYVIPTFADCQKNLILVDFEERP